MSRRRDKQHIQRADLKALLDDVAATHPNSIVETVVAPVPPVIVAALARARSKVKPGEEDPMVVWGEAIGNGQIRVLGIMDLGAVFAGIATNEPPDDPKGSIRP